MEERREIRWHAEASDELRDELTRAVRGHRTLEDVVRWGLEAHPARIVANVVVQDEFTHDVVLPYADNVWLVYDAT